MPQAVKAPARLAGPTTPSIATASAVRTLVLEGKAVNELRRRFDDPEFGAAFAAVADLIVNSTGRLIVTGIGKSGIIARKIAATMTSTGTPSIYLHAAEAGHGDLGMITGQDVVMALSWSGETTELSDVLTYCTRFEIPLVGVTSRPGSTLATYSSLCVRLPQVAEACPNRMAPTTSTIVQAAFGDALAVALIEVRGFSTRDFLRFHPRGHLGAQLMTIRQVMSSGDAVPRVTDRASVREAMLEMSAKRFGITAIVDDDAHVVGAFTDGDLRRALERGIHGSVRDYMTVNPVVVAPETLVSEVLALMNQRAISQVFVGDGGSLIGVAHIHDVLRTGVV